MSHRACYAMACNQTMRAVMAAIRANDPVAFLDEDVVRALAAGLRDAGLCHFPHPLGSEIVCTELKHVNTTCDSCGGELHARQCHGANAKILHTSGMLSKRDIPLRCRNGSCDLKEVHVWHNYISKGGEHMFHGDVTKINA